MAKVYVSLLLAAIQAAALTVAPGSPDACPTSAQVVAALQAHAPALLAARIEDDPAKLLTLNLMPTSGGDTNFSLTDRAGVVRLYRSLPPPAADRTRDCPALADTVALIIIRYFEEVEMPALPERPPAPPPPPPPPPPPAPSPEPPKPASTVVAKPSAPATPVAVEPVRAALSFNGGLRNSDPLRNPYQGMLNAALVLVHTKSREWDLWLEAAAGISGATIGGQWPGGGGTWNNIRSSADLALLPGWRNGQGRLFLGPAATLDVVRVDVTLNLNDRALHQTAVGVAAGIKAGYQYFWSNHLFTRADIAGDLTLRPFEILTQPGANRSVVYATPTMYFTASVGIGVWF